MLCHYVESVAAALHYVESVAAALHYVETVAAALPPCGVCSCCSATMWSL